MIKLIASDLDGTIIDNTHSIPEANIKAINDLQKANIPFVVCTGKTFSISKDICKNLNANFGIFGNGSQIIDLSTGEEISRKVLTLDDITTCISIAQKYNLHIHAYTENGIITPSLEYMALRNSLLFPNKIKFEVVNDILDYIKKQNITIFKLIFSADSNLLKIKEELESITNLTIMHITKIGRYKDKIIDKEYEYLDISPLNVTKGKALEILGQYLELNKENILSVGDNINDIDMFHASGIGAAVSNAYDEVKQVANYVTVNSADEAGFAEAIYKFVPFSMDLN
jgi:Cof subfamily protein (haloacid dehalogenase superfamily)